MSTTISYSAGYTRNLGNFESARVDFSIATDEFKPGEKPDDVKARLKAKVDLWVQDAVEEVDAEARQ
jgi:hypothetical protein